MLKALRLCLKCNSESILEASRDLGENKMYDRVALCFIVVEHSLLDIEEMVFIKMKKKSFFL